MNLLIYDKQTKEIIQSRFPAQGDAPPLTLENCFPPWEQEMALEKYNAIPSPYAYFTSEAKERLRVIGDEVYHKPMVVFSFPPEIIVDEPFTLKVSLDETLPEDDFVDVAVMIGEVPVTLPLGESEMIFEFADKYLIKVNDKRYQPLSLSVEVLDNEV